LALAMGAPDRPLVEGRVMGRFYPNSSVPSRKPSAEEIERERRERQRDLDDIDSEINWAYQQMRIIEAHLEGAIEHHDGELSDRESKRVDKALVVTRTGLKMLKKVIKNRAPHIDTAAWRSTHEVQ
jgi:hypothetical protein